MAFDIDRIAVEAKTKALKAEYTTELAQDLKAVHGLDAETELSNILSTEILSELNREVIRTLYHVAKLGCQQSDIQKRAMVSTTFMLTQMVAGVQNASVVSCSKLSVKQTQIAKETRRGKGNFVVCTSDVASALAMGGFLNISPALKRATRS
jgi:hypothetical protein